MELRVCCFKERDIQPVTNMSPSTILCRHGTEQKHNHYVHKNLIHITVSTHCTSPKSEVAGHLRSKSDIC